MASTSDDVFVNEAFEPDDGIAKVSPATTNNRRSFVYHLTQKGRDLAPIILEVVIWSGVYDDRPNAMREVLEKILRDHSGFEAKLRKG